MPPRRAVLALPLIAAACGGQQDPVPVPPGPLGFRYLVPLPLNVAAIEVAEASPAPAPGDVGAALSPGPAEAVRIMARDRLQAVGSTGRAEFAVTQASLLQGRDFLTCMVGCRLEVLADTGTRLGFVEAQSRRAVTGSDAGRPRAAEALLRRAMDDLNVEFEFQVRRNLKDWLVEVAAGTEGGVPAPPTIGVEREDLPRAAGAREAPPQEPAAPPRE